VLDCQAKIGGAPEGGAAILVNSGNANAFTGRRGTESVEAVTAAVADSLGVAQARVFSSSTGVIGEPLAHERITGCLEDLRAGLSQHGIKAAAEAIGTTDTYPKGAGTTVMIDAQLVHIAGIAKGSGMIAPDMSTMLVYIFTDAAIDQQVLQDTVSALNRTTFNCITVDSDTSTSDTLLVAATGGVGDPGDRKQCQLHGRPVAGHARSRASGRARRRGRHKIHRDFRDRCGLRCRGAQGSAKAIANSPLVKTAVAGEDPNWGRVVMAVGKSGARADRDLLAIWFGDLQVARDGFVSPDHDEARAAAYMKNDEIVIHVDLGLGGGTARVWTCDLTHGYIDINADYRS